jgi:DNA-binding CsgD family transcriptional regulator
VAVRQVRRSGSSASPSAVQLTSQQARVLHLAVVGHSDREIGEALHIGRETVKSHLRQAFRRLGVRSRAEAAIRVVAPPMGESPPEWPQVSPNGGLQPERGYPNFLTDPGHLTPHQASLGSDRSPSCFQGQEGRTDDPDASLT